jgi:hypothetical protein
LTPDIAEKYEQADSEFRHWTSLAEGAPVGHLTVQVHKFITPHLTGAFMHYFSFEGKEWANDDSTTTTSSP